MSTFANKRYDMNKFPTSYEIFGLDCLGEEASESLKMEYISHCVDDCISEALNPYKEIFNSKSFRFEEGEME